MSSTRPPPGRERTLEETRADMSETLHEIEDRLSPTMLREQVMGQLDDARIALRTQLKEEVQELGVNVNTAVKAEIVLFKQQLGNELDEAKAAVRAATLGKVETMAQNASDTINDVRHNVMSTIRENPIPTALIGVGLMWFLINGTSSGKRTSRRVSHYASDVAERTEHAASGVLDRARALGGEAVIEVRDAAQSAGNAVTTLAHDTRDVERRVERTMQENPLAVGAVAFALGTALGLVLPSSKREDSMMGDTRDHLVNRAERAAHAAVRTAESSLSHAIGAARETVLNGESGVNNRTTG